MKYWTTVVFGLLLAAIGGAGGWMAASQLGLGSTEDHGAHDDDAGHQDTANAGGDAAAEPALSAITLRNMGVTTGELELQTYVGTRDIPAIVEALPLNEQPLFAPIGGRVQEIRAQPGMMVNAGDVLMVLHRDPIPRPELLLTREILRPTSESIHEAVVELRRTLLEISILRVETKRVAEFTATSGTDDLPILPKQKQIDLGYKLQRAETSHSQAIHELEKHGFDEKQIREIADGKAIPNLGEVSWQRALQRNGLWPAAAAELLELLPTRLRQLPWVIATIGELAASGLIRGELLAWLKTVPKDCGHFLEIGSLLQRGYTVADIRALHELGALNAVIEIAAHPRMKDWDVGALNVKAGAHVEAGARLLTLVNSRSMYIKCQPVGGEQFDILKAVEKGTRCRAVPLVEKAGPTLEGLVIEYLSSGNEASDAVAYLPALNEVLAVRSGSSGARHRSWKLRNGLQYVLQVPVETVGDVFVIPASAVARIGERRVVFTVAGTHFHEVEIEIIASNDQVVVVPYKEGSILFPGETIVQSGAYALEMALRGEVKQDAHAGHSH